ncbi:MAG: CHAD domain-containing protein [Aquabacterium sp.]|nr:CHAD domain-containing protein [Aquabacterium sp.]
MKLTLAVPAARKAEVLEALCLTGAPNTSQFSCYFDTQDGRMAAKGLSLRLQREGRRWVQTLKADDVSSVRCLEDSIVVRAPKGRNPSIDLERHSTDVARQALEKALGAQSSKAWQPLIKRFEVKVSRRARDIDKDGEKLGLAFDVGHIEAHGERRPVCELNIELKSDGSYTHMFALAKKLVHEHHLWLSTESRSTRGNALLSDQAHALVVKAQEVDFDPSVSDGQKLRAMVRNCLRQVLPNASQVAAGSENSEHIHQLRVGLRRLRTILKEAQPLVNGVDQAWEDMLASAFRQLGVYRDHESMAKNLQPRLLAAGGQPITSWPPSIQAAHAPRLTVRDTGFQSTLLSVLAFTFQPDDQQLDGASRFRKALAKKLDRLHSQVVADGSRFTKLPVDQQHQVRKRLKKLRYLCEFAKPLFKPGKVERYLDSLRPAQGALGTHNDDAVALEMWRRHPPVEAAGWFAMGWLSSNQIRTAEVCLKALKKVKDAERFWA